jgi:predicted glutamine amidotransferase
MFVARSQIARSFGAAFQTLRRLAQEHKDGWGVAPMDSLTPQCETSIASAAESPRFVELGNSLISSSVFAHIRLASVGTVQLQNTHPFFAQGFWFMHNGTVQRFSHSRAGLETQLCPNLSRLIKGETDSERCFLLFLTLLNKPASEASDEEVGRTLAQVVRLVKATCDLDETAIPSALNFAVSDGVRVWATRMGRSLVLAEDGDCKFIASEPLFPGVTWSEVPEGSLVSIDRHLRWEVTPLASH